MVHDSPFSPRTGNCPCSETATMPEYRRAVACLSGAAVFRLCVSAMTLWLIPLAAGCNYSTQRPFRQDIQTVHVDMFQSREFRRELEFQLTEALVKRIELDTPYRIGPRSTSDLLIEGELLSVENRSFGDDFDTDLPREIGSTVVVRLRIKDMRSGKILVERPRFVYQSSYIPPIGEGFDEGMVRAMDGLAESIVETMEVDW